MACSHAPGGLQRLSLVDKEIFRCIPDTRLLLKFPHPTLVRMSPSRKPDCDVAIVGGGPIGLTLALSLAREGVRSVVFDSVQPGKFREAEFDGRAYAISLASRCLLSNIGVWSPIADQARRIDDILVTDGRVSEGASPLFLHFSSAEFGGEGFGHMIEDRWLRNALWDRVEEEASVQVHAPSRVTETRAINGIAVVETESGTRLRAPVIAACDGRFSPCAERLGISRTGWAYGQTALVCAIRHTKSHKGCAHEYFLPAGPFAILPLRGNMSSIVWTEETATADYIRRAGGDVFDLELRRRVGKMLGDLEVCGRRWFYPLEFSLADTYVANRLALVGDAAHRIHPIAGQGLNVGFLDVGVLVETIVDALRRGEDIGASDVLGRYESRRRPDATILALATDALNRLFSRDDPVLRFVRDIGMSAVGRSGPMRRFFMARAAGIGGGIPKPMRPDRS